MPARHVPGSTVQASGAGFQPGVRAGARLGAARVARFRIDPRGGFSLSYRVPMATRHGRRPLVVRAGGRRVALRVSVGEATGTVSSRSAAGRSRRLQLAPYSAAPGVSRRIRGLGWPAKVLARAFSGGVLVGRARTGRRGRLTIATQGPTLPGRHRVVVRAAGRRLAIPFEVVMPTPSPTPSPEPPPGSPPPTRFRIAAAGDIACVPGTPMTATTCRHGPVSDLLVGAGLSAVLPLGDLQYDEGELAGFLGSYDPTWGRVKSITFPSPGNKEYQSGNADGYFGYFGARAGDRALGYYAFDIGSWRLYSLNSNCAQVACGVGSAQETWLKADLAAHPRTCQIAYWHHPLFNSGNSGPTNAMRPIWNALDAAGVELVLTGHNHSYERFAPQDVTGAADPAGPREFIVGTGGRSHAAPPAAGPAANSEIRNFDTFGVLELTLDPARFDWRFVPEAGKTFTDAGSQDCH